MSRSMKSENRKLWGQTNALYTQRCAEHGVNSYRRPVIYALDAVALFNTVFEKEVDNERQNQGIF